MVNPEDDQTSSLSDGSISGTYSQASTKSTTSKSPQKYLPANTTGSATHLILQRNLFEDTSYSDDIDVGDEFDCETDDELNSLIRATTARL